MSVRSSASFLCMQRRCYTALQSHVENAKLSDKIVRGPLPTRFYKHPSFVMSREKMLSGIWVDVGVFKYSFNALLPFFTVAYFLKA